MRARTRIWSPFGPTSNYNSFDEQGSLKDSAGIVTSFSYDSNGNLLTKTVTGSLRAVGQPSGRILDLGHVPRMRPAVGVMRRLGRPLV